jgi:hypothetical protein
MDIVGIIKKSYRSYGSIISEDYLAFFKETNEIHVRKIFY